ncbi:MAG TPA: protein kinase [Planctomycetota bacterium]|nr:protein kinase [Planctomycetota bacterium]
MSASPDKPGEKPHPPVPARATPADASDSELAEDLAATSITSKGPPPDARPEDESDDLDATSINVKIQQIPGLKLVRELGRGAAGVVYHGKQEFLDREVAVKMLLEQRKNPEYTARFKREAKLLAGLQHPHIVACYQADVTPDGVCFLVMEFVAGPNLREHLVEKGPLDVLDALRVCRDLAAALECAYEKKIIHRDVKSENVLLANEPRALEASKFPYRAKLSDLGLARPETKDATASGTLHLTVGATIMGTPLNMSPEQFDDPQGVDHRTDIYSLGCVLYDMLVAQPAFLERTLSKLVIAKNNAVRGPDPRRVRGEIDADVSELVMSMIAAKREDRPQTYAELIATCERLIEKLGGTAVPVPTRRRAPWIAAGACALLGSGAGLWWMSSREAAKPSAPPSAAFALRIKPVTEAEEGKTVVLTALAEGAQAPLQVEWKQVGEKTVELTRVGDASASFVAPRATLPYELSFQASATSGDKHAEAEPLTFTVNARDDAPVIRIEGATIVRERERVTLTASVADPDRHGALEYAWSHIGGSAGSQHSGSSLPLEPDQQRVSFTAPESDAPYSLQLALEVRAGAGRWRADPVTIEVTAINDPPVMTLLAPKSAEAGEVVALSAEVSDVDSQGALKYEWRVESPAGMAVAFDDRNARRTRFTAPENKGDYELVLALLTWDGAQPPVQQTLTLAVASDPALAALSAGEKRSWSSRVVADALPGWAPSEPKPQLSDGVDGGVLLRGEQECWITRDLPRGKFSVSLKLQPQIVKSAACGVRLVADPTHAVELCFLPKEGDACGLVAFATTWTDGAWTIPGPEKQRPLEEWESYKSMELELDWDGTTLSARWRDPESASWSASVPLGLGARPRSLSLFAAHGMMLVEDVAIRGL